MILVFPQAEWRGIPATLQRAADSPPKSELRESEKCVFEAESAHLSMHDAHHDGHFHDDQAVPMIFCHSWPPINKNEAKANLAESWGSNLSSKEKQQLLKAYEESFDDYRTVKRELVHSFSKDRLRIMKPSWMRPHPTTLLYMALPRSVGVTDTDINIHRSELGSNGTWKLYGSPFIQPYPTYSRAEICLYSLPQMVVIHSLYILAPHSDMRQSLVYLHSSEANEIWHKDALRVQ